LAAGAVHPEVVGQVAAVIVQTLPAAVQVLRGKVITVVRPLMALIHRVVAVAVRVQLVP
jgi:hypothetical protein